MLLLKSYRGVTLLILSALLFTSCNRSCKGGAEGEQVINVDVAYPIETLDPRHATSATATRISKLVYGALFEIDDHDFSAKPFLAESIEAIDDKTFRVTLRDGLTFHDGSPLTADDVVYSLGDLGTADVASPNAEKFSYLESIKAESTRAVIFKLKKPFAPFLTDLCAQGIVSKKACLNRSKECRHENVGSGPYRVKEWDTAKETITLTPFEKWFEGPPKSALKFRVVRDENTRILELRGKKADLVEGDFSATNIVDLKKQPHLSVQEIPGLGYSYLAFNVRGPKGDEPKDSPQYRTRLALANKQVRQAIAHAINFDQIIETIFLGTAKRASGMIPNGHWAKDETLKPTVYNKDLAEKELDQAGFKRTGKDNMRFSVSIMTTPNRLRQNIAQLYADYLKQVGINVTIRVKEWGALYQDMKQGQFELFSANWVPVTEPDLYFYVHHSSSIPEGEKAGGNRHGYKNPEVDRLIERARTTIDNQERKALYQQIERIMLEDLPYIPLWFEDRIVVVNSERIQGFKPSPSGSFLGLRFAMIANTNEKKANH